MEERFSNRYLAGILTVARAASRTHFYGSGMGQHSEGTLYNAFFRKQCNRRS